MSQDLAGEHEDARRPAHGEDEEHALQVLEAQGLVEPLLVLQLLPALEVTAQEVFGFDLGTRGGVTIGFGFLFCFVFILFVLFVLSLPPPIFYI